MISVIGIGDNVCDKYIHLNKMYPGGQALNFAVFSKMLGINSAYMGVFGNDKVGEHIITTLDKIGVDISHCRHFEGENGYAVVDLVQGERVFVKSNKGGVLRLNPLEFSTEDLEYLKNFQVIHTSNNSYIDSQLETLASLGSTLSYDFSTSWRDDQRTKDICKHVNFAFMSCPNLNEEEIKNQLFIAHNFGTEIVVATRGNEGAIIYDGNMFFESKPKKVNAIDTLGAGDSFATTFLTSFILDIGKDLGKEMDKNKYEGLVYICLDKANKIASQTCMVFGAFGHGTNIS
ncbi:fructoselysine 6-kinase [Paratissierella segnis]|jgi:sugar/nucleoside kinase (ribokinase family)|uniref:Fructoselysine 6-kinase n=1 Tax=Paratissierella segnis TaxID=2763679 RepID=A0A926ESU4_9FIRM|nr:fructoselysine 6-kinase [Paratissierella segnis]MBC8588236.1 fructoselysine 6-kinase [Paratissierella segnis]